MKYATVEGQRAEARPGMKGNCASCEAAVIAKCGNKRVWHWAHVGIRNCDTWWEPETEWHRNWKNQFPSEWQEIRRKAPDGEWHIADVRTEEGKVIEFQHSNISHSERTSREQFYGEMVWVVDGARLKRDLPSFFEALSNRRPIGSHPARWQLSIDDAAILARWRGSQCIVYVDFGLTPYNDLAPATEPVLWRLKYRDGYRSVIVTPVQRNSFLAHVVSHQKLKVYRHPTAQVTVVPSVGYGSRQLQQSGFAGFESYMRAKNARRPRF